MNSAFANNKIRTGWKKIGKILCSDVEILRDVDNLYSFAPLDRAGPDDLFAKSPKTDHINRGAIFLPAC